MITTEKNVSSQLLCWENCEAVPFLHKINSAEKFILESRTLLARMFFCFPKLCHGAHKIQEMIMFLGHSGVSRGGRWGESKPRHHPAAPAAEHTHIWSSLSHKPSCAGTSSGQENRTGKKGMCAKLTFLSSPLLIHQAALCTSGPG